MVPFSEWTSDVGTLSVSNAVLESQFKQLRTDMDFSTTIRTVTFQNACNVIRELTARLRIDVFLQHIFSLKYSVLFGLFKFGLDLGLKHLVAFNISVSSCIRHVDRHGAL